MEQTNQTPAAAPSPVVNPGHGLGIASLITSLLGIGLVGIILGSIGLSKSKKVGQKNGLALAGIIIGAIDTVATIIIIAIVASVAAQLVQQCNDLGNGTHVVNGVTITCGASSSSIYNY